LLRNKFYKEVITFINKVCQHIINTERTELDVDYRNQQSVKTKIRKLQETLAFPGEAGVLAF